MTGTGARIAAVVALVLGLSVGVGLGLVWAGNDSVTTGGASGTTNATEPSAGEESLFVVEAPRGWIEPDGDRAWTLHLEASRVLWFADRPARASGTISVEELVSLWAEAFGDSPPNGAITAPDGPGGDRPTALVVGRPTNADGILSFPVTADKGMTNASAQWLSEMTRGRSDEYGGMAFFIDSTLNKPFDFHVLTNTANLRWNEGQSSCAGYGTSSPTVDAGFVNVIEVKFIAFFSGSCWFDPTDAVFDILDYDGDVIGHVTWDGGGDITTCTGGTITCNSTSGSEQFEIVSSRFPALPGD